MFCEYAICAWRVLTDVRFDLGHLLPAAFVYGALKLSDLKCDA